MTAISEEGKVEELPDFDGETLPHWRRFETAWGAGKMPNQAKKGKRKKRVAVTMEEDGEGGVSIEAEENDLGKEEDGDEMEDYYGPPEPVAADEYGRGDKE